MDLTGGCCGTRRAEGCEVADSGSSERSQATGLPGLGLFLTAKMLGGAGLLLGQRVDGKVQVPSPLLHSGVLSSAPAGRAPEGAAAEEQRGQPGSALGTAGQVGPGEHGCTTQSGTELDSRRIMSANPR